MTSTTSKQNIITFCLKSNILYAEYVIETKKIIQCTRINKIMHFKVTEMLIIKAYMLYN